MKRIRYKQPKIKTKISTRKRITSKISDTIQHNEYTLQNTSSTLFNKTSLRFYEKNDENESYFKENNDDESYYKENDNESYYGEDGDKNYYGEDDDDESYYGEDDDEQVGRSSTEYIQTIVDGKADFEPLSGDYGPYFQNFTEIMLFTWVTKHMISKY